MGVAPALRRAPFGNHIPSLKKQKNGRDKVSLRILSARYRNRHAELKASLETRYAMALAAETMNRMGSDEFEQVGSCNEDHLAFEDDLADSSFWREDTSPSRERQAAALLAQAESVISAGGRRHVAPDAAWTSITRCPAMTDLQQPVAGRTRSVYWVPPQRRSTRPTTHQGVTEVPRAITTLTTGQFSF